MHLKLLFIHLSISFLFTAYSCKNKEQPSTCATTEDIEGPFYRDGAPVRNDLNVSGINSNKLVIKGTVFGVDCKTALHGATVDIWQADEKGEYDNQNAEYRFRGKVRTDSAGRYIFHTVLPGKYKNGSQYRPGHIHIKATADGHKELVTQLYFQGDEDISKDPWASKEEAKSRILSLEKDTSGTSHSSFDIVLMPVK